MGRLGGGEAGFWERKVEEVGGGRGWLQPRVKVTAERVHSYAKAFQQQQCEGQISRMHFVFFGLFVFSA